MKRGKACIFILVVLAIQGLISSCEDNSDKSNSIEITNVSYDPTRELYENYNKEFQSYWKDKTGEDIVITQSHGGSGKQARSVIEGNEADIVTLALGYDISAIENTKLINKDWQSEFKNNSSPYTSTIVFLVRKGNPKNIISWEDLIKDDVGIITPNPKTSGGARWNYLAAWAYAEKEYNNDETKIKEYMSKLFKNVLSLDSGSRGATTTFVQNGQGDVLLAWENEAYLAMKEHPDEFEIITPSISILAEPPVAVVDEIVDKKNTRDVATAYLEHLYSDEGQRIAGENYYRPSNKNIEKEFADKFDLDVQLVSIDDNMFGGWDEVQKKHFSDGGTFDEIYSNT